VLVEKEAHAQQYPLTSTPSLSLHQATNRDPVVTLEESDVLVPWTLSARSTCPGGPSLPWAVGHNRYRHVMDEFLSIDTEAQLWWPC